MIERDALIRHYMRMGDAEFTAFATHEVAGLVPEAVEIVRSELKRRGRVPDPDATIDVQLRRLSSEEFERMLKRFRQEPCPNCGSTVGPLNAVWVSLAGRREAVAGCVPCLEKRLKHATGSLAAVGAVLSPDDS